MLPQGQATAERRAAGNLGSVSSLVRQLKRAASNLPAPAKRAAQTAFTAVDPLLVRSYRRRHPITVPIPPVALRARVGAPEIAGYLAGADGCIATAEGVLGSTGSAMSDFGEVLDFGCGCGRILVPFWRRWGPEAAPHGCDIDEPAIAWLRRHYPDIRAEVNDFHPPPPYEDGRFGLLYSVSVFTHLDERGQQDWLGEVRRVLRPRGVALMTIHGDRAFRDFASGEAVGAIHRARDRIGSHSLEENGFVYEPAEPSGWNALRLIEDGDGWRLTFHSADYVRERWGKLLSQVEILPGKGRQDVVLVRG
jgi:SAM-dependent methyltransferase